MKRTIDEVREEVLSTGVVNMDIDRIVEIMSILFLHIDYLEEKLIEVNKIIKIWE